ncbi:MULTISPECIES: hypothetical protein [Streptomyces]|uniref:Uncharacterized protein n=1 Tax=Streptomyces tsukubensis (strain DSM 42081 / NBRC 108919 / NRRL 18488 / 9993) TaxID=1114943 RepID=I2N6Q6_STRT9|nr:MULTISPECIES: hypothetical protein [Streptomyces]AZK96633.1 hypothetical protein B7R87_24275 [Streptomyces tsukubensis]EIF92703.1 hypothetical protein [Streptomyces tsukubensis NRRL18488]MYS67829.1 hypothetical protein [Streptomyces sp. SID5473]QKM67365.1 hypothetical protein STSU_009495 [Streptomyces tsukubensis NRRL18488]TAI42068.1 hypothetical protein EWI31_24355 [Streptomyces tsukubensis]
MSESEQPHVVIVREQGGNVAAIPHGGFARAEHGDLAVEMLRHAGFIDDHSPLSRQYRLHWDMGREYERRQATSAARMLTAAGFRVDLDPTLDTDRLTTPSDPGGRRVLGQQLLRLTDQLGAARSPAEAADLAEHVLDPHDGVLVRLSQFFETAVEVVRDVGANEGWEVADAFEAAAEALTTISDDLDETAGELRSLCSGAAAPGWRAQVTGYYATAPARAAAPPSGEAQPAVNPVPAPGRIPPRSR